MQEISDSLPSSRFSHAKDSEMNVYINEFEFRTYPDACRPSEAHKNNVIFYLRQWDIRVRGRAFQDAKAYRMIAKELDIHSDMLVDELSSSSRTKVYSNPCQVSDNNIDKNYFNFFGTKWSLPNMSVTFNLGRSNMALDEFRCDAVNIDCFDECLDIMDGHQRQLHNFPFMRSSPVLHIPYSV